VVGLLLLLLLNFLEHFLQLNYIDIESPKSWRWLC